MEGQSGVTRNISDERNSSDIQGDQRKVKVVLLEVSLMNLILEISMEIKWKVKVVLIKISLMNFILRISNEIKWTVKVVLPEVSLMNVILRISKEIKRKVNLVLLQVSLMIFILRNPSKTNGMLQWCYWKYHC